MRTSLLVLLALAAPAALAQQSSPASSLSPAASIEQAKADVAELREHRDAVNKRLELLLASGEAAQARCVSGPANALRALSEVADAAFVSMNQSFSEGEDARAAYEGRKIAVAIAKARELRARADACEGTAAESTFGFLVEHPDDEDAEIDPGNVDLGTDPPDSTPFE